MTEQTDALSRLRFDCPHCGAHMKVRTSKTHLPVFRELYLHCSREFECGYRCKADLNVTETLAPSRTPNPDIDVKTSSWLMRQVRLDLAEEKESPK